MKCNFEEVNSWVFSNGILIIPADLSNLVQYIIQVFLPAVMAAFSVPLQFLETLHDCEVRVQIMSR